MPKKYAIHTKNANPRFPPVGKYATVEFREDCAGCCSACVKKKCVYGIFKENFLHWSSMQEPEYLYICKGCYRCVQDCTKGIFSMSINPEYRALGDEYWDPDIISSTWAQAHTGRIPVSGAGYRGPFVGQGFDSIWTDMSEIVRPTRDGIHGREYINTTVELSRRPTRLKFNQDMSLAMDLPPILEVPLPVLFQKPEFGVLGEGVLLSVLKAAAAMGSLMFLKPEDYSPAVAQYRESIVPCLTAQDYSEHADMIRNSRMVELAYGPSIEREYSRLRSIKPGLAIAVGMPLDAATADRALALAQTDVDTIHLYGSSHGREVDSNAPRYMKDMIRQVHLKLLQGRVRDKINLVFSGGMAMAEHMAKSLICGADAVAVDVILLVALECRLCYRCKENKPCPVKLEEVPPEWGAQRILNLVSSWRNQLIEVMGAFGIREARRVRGETGRSLWFEDLEKENFGPLFGIRKVAGIG
ncbi:MAG: hypothetical protein HYX87_08675 [Chloroflexi bacterium]|nr:hypothetical protein [Chloroflexota bacterium]